MDPESDCMSFFISSSSSFCSCMYRRLHFSHNSIVQALGSLDNFLRDPLCHPIYICCCRRLLLAQLGHRLLHLQHHHHRWISRVHTWDRYEHFIQRIFTICVQQLLISACFVRHFRVWCVCFRLRITVLAILFRQYYCLRFRWLWQVRWLRLRDNGLTRLQQGSCGKLRCKVDTTSKLLYGYGRLQAVDDSNIFFKVCRPRGQV